MNDGAAGDLWSPPAESVRAELDRIVASPDFTASERARRFLRYVVEETLGGRSERIKAYSVAIEVFGRDSTFDAQNDPAVRIEAGRLRRALERYYLLAGQHDSIVISIPKGGYVPIFGARTAPATETIVAPATVVDVPAAQIAERPAPQNAQAWYRRFLGALIAVPATLAVIAGTGLPSFDERQAYQRPAGPSLLVLPFADLGNDTTSALYSAALTDELVTAFSRFKEITVFGVRTSRSAGLDADIKRLHDELDVKYVLEGSVRTNADSIFVSGRLLDAANGAVIWSQKFDNPLTADDLFAIQASTAEQVANAVAQPYGIVFQAELARAGARPPNDLGAYLCSLRYYVYRATPSHEGHAEVRDCLEAAVAQFPNYATAWALLGHVYLDEARHNLNRRPGTPDGYQRALAASEEAVRLEPENPRALQSEATALFYTKHVEQAFDVARRAIAMTPNDAELLGQFGQLFGLGGQFVEGRTFLEQAIARNPAQSSFYRGTLALIAYMQHDYDTALAEIVRADLQKLPIYFGVAAIIYAEKGLDSEARAAASDFQRLQPDFVPNFWSELAARNIPVQTQLQIAKSFAKAGMTVPSQPAARRGMLPSPAASEG
jgi:adenylate cyclase